MTARGRIAEYELKDRLGGTGLTETYRTNARPATGARALALKLLCLDRLPEESRKLATDRFLAAGKRAQAATVGGMGRVVEVGEDREGPFIASELVPGLDLAHLVQLARRRTGTQVGLEPQLAAAICAQAARVLTSAHESSPPLFHLGLGPSCVRVTPVAGVMIVDFGLTAALRGLGQQQISTWYFLPPELLTADASEVFDGSGAAADLYSLGALLYYLLAGRPPVEAASLTQLVERAWVGPAALPGLPAHLTRILGKLLAPDPAQRPTSAREVAEILSQGMVSPQERRHYIASALRGLGIAERPGKAKADSAAPATMPPPATANAPSTTSAPPAAPAPPRPEPRRLARERWRWRAILAGVGLLGLAGGWGGLMALRGARLSGDAERPRGPATEPAPPAKLTMVEIPSPPVLDAGTGLDSNLPFERRTPAKPARKLPRVPLRLNLDTTPIDADVWVDGVLRGKTPVDIYIGPEGHRVVVIKEGFRMKRAVYDGNEGEWIRLFLERIEPTPARDGAVTVRCRSNNRYPIFVDDEETGRLCPAANLPVRAGRHRIGVFVPNRRGMAETEVEVPVGRPATTVTLGD